MKYIKTFEELDDIAFSVGDIVVCIFNPIAPVGTKFKVERIHTYKGDNMTEINLNHITESQHTKEYFVEVRVLDGSSRRYKKYKKYNTKPVSFWSTRFVSEMKYNEMKYNL